MIKWTVQEESVGCQETRAFPAEVVRARVGVEVTVPRLIGLPGRTSADEEHTTPRDMVREGGERTRGDVGGVLLREPVARD
jgi:hypothetical protein